MDIASPRDSLSRLKLKHRNLYIANEECPACGEKMSQLHLVDCDIIRQEYWWKWRKLMNEIGCKWPEMDSRHQENAFLILGTMKKDKVASK